MDKRDANTKNGRVRQKDIFMSEGLCIKPIISLYFMLHSVMFNKIK